MENALHLLLLVALLSGCSQSDDIFSEQRTTHGTVSGQQFFRPGSGWQEKWESKVKYEDSRYGDSSIKATTDESREWQTVITYEDGRKEYRETDANNRWKP